MYTYKLLVALSLIANPDTSPKYETLTEIFPFSGWEEIETRDSAVDGLVIFPLKLLNDLITSELRRFEPASGPARLHAFLAPTLKQAAIKLEIMDQRESTFHDPQNFLKDLKLLQNRFQDLCNAPPLADCLHFPDRESINELLALNRSFHKELTERLTLDRIHAAEIRQAIAETDQLYQVWTTLRDARCGYYYVAVRRSALKQLRDLIGEPAFYRGELPPNVPVWRIPRGR